MSWLEVSWLLWITAGVLLNGGLQWKGCLPAGLQDALHYGKLKLRASVVGQIGPSSPPPSSWGQLLNVPKRWFTHFYAWGLIWNLSILTLYLLSCMAGLPSSPDPLTAVLGPVIGPLVGVDLELACRSETAGGGITQKQFDVAVVLCLVCVQVARRLYECLFVSVFSPDGSMHVLHYIMGLYFYSALGPTALLHLTSGVSDPRPVSPDSLIAFLHWYHAFGLCLFFMGSWHQHNCHKILARLRRRGRGRGSSNSDSSPTPKSVVSMAPPVKAKELNPAIASSSSGSDVYGLPRGDWFEYVSSPHYLAEILLYAGTLMLFVVESPWTPWWLVVAFTVSTLTLSARQIHVWYKEKFEDYPKSRRVLIPGVY